ncbi:MAG: sialidase family protein [Promethearchaeota archaeon]
MSNLFEIMDVFDPKNNEKFCGKNSHGSSITELPDGRIMCVWYCGSFEKSADTGIYYAIYDPNSKEWTTPQLLEKESDRKSEGNPVIFYDQPTSRLWLFWATMDRAEYKHLPGGWSTCKLKAKHSDDLGKTWTQSRYLTKFWGRMTRNKPIRLSNGDVILPIYSEWMGYKANFFIWTADEFKKGALNSRYKKVGPIKGGVLQPTLVELEDGHILALFRTSSHSKYAGYITKSESLDYGRHWTSVSTIDLPNPNGGIDMVKTNDRNIVLAFNNSKTARNPLSVAFSEDNGKTWSKIKDIEKSDNGRYGYPAIIQAKDGTFYCSYTNTGGVNIRCAHFDMNWLQN